MEKSVIMENIFRNVNNELTAEDIMMLSPLQLAYIGDAVYELLVRTYLIKRGHSVGKLHKLATKYVKAKAQANIVHNIEGNLTQSESDIIRRGRNSKSNTVPKNANMMDYKYATGFEALIGYLYLNEEYIRIIELFDMIKDMDI